MHICGFFDSREQQYDVIIPYIMEGLGANDKVINILESDRHSEHCRCLADNGISIAKKMASGQLEILSSENSYIKDGKFAADKMYAMLENTLLSASRAGYDSVRACGDMVWALKNLPGTDELLAYEASLNELTPKYSCSLICMYDVSNFSQNTLAEVLLTHPYVIKDGKITKNPHYIEAAAVRAGFSDFESKPLKS
ncbi:hypothetical protein GR160_19085 [Flavobacterium sp. Sd200]|uniref:MEDS domain-containing protein n=1 Tax=Flavobacterium sp. Sd200 TaxID=2692211 RepID=UPI0013695E62|nr:MEDS domain-containing protein [Flavobacterium sp. Sd200]MXN93334.1 hypothetical protein [Flavobacterium sp. Sd200]